jgi:hypothetical protein
MIIADVGVSTPLELMLFDGATSKGVLARIRTTAGVEVASVVLTHIGDGLYTGSWTPSIAGFYHASFIVYVDTDMAIEDRIYSRTTQVYKITTPEQIASAVWDSLWPLHQIDNSFGKIVSGFINSFDPSEIANNIWNDLTSEHTTPGTFGRMVQDTWSYARAHLEELKHPAWGLDKIYSSIQVTSANTDALVAENGTKLDALIPLLGSIETNIIGEISQNRVLLINMEVQNEENTQEILAAIEGTNAHIDSVGVLVASMQNNTTARFVVPERLVKPTTGTKSYQFHLSIYDSTGAPKSPDFAPTIRVRRLDSGVDIVLNDPMTQDGVKVGCYYYSFTISSSTNDYPALVEAAITESGVVRYIPSVTEVTEFESDLNAIQAQLTAVDTKVITTNQYLTNGTYGLAALKTSQDGLLSAILAETALVGAVKAKTDLIPNDIAVGSDINLVLAAIGQLPTLTQITNLIDDCQTSILGPDGRTITDVYNLWDVSALLRSDDPRLNYLDTKISTRSTLKAYEVWGYATRTLTNSVLSPASIQSIWAYLTSDADDLPGSMGAYIVDKLDAKVSSRATQSEMLSMLSGVAQESTLSATNASIDDKYADLISKLANITVKLIGVKAKTDLIPPSPASEYSVTGGTTSILHQLAEMESNLSLIKSKTDHLPLDPASESSVISIPRNPLLTSDARLNNLDARISTRSTLTVSDLANLATKSDLTAAKNSIITEVETNRAGIVDLMEIAIQIKIQTDKITDDPATASALQDALDAILLAISEISAGSGASPAQIWNYSSRTLTQDPQSFGPDISNLATKDDVAAISSANQYANKMTTTLNPATGLQEVLVWAEKDGHPVNSATNCTIFIKDALGTTKWTQSSSVANSDGVFRFINPVVVTEDANYYIVMAVTVEGAVKISQQSFITVG